MTVNISGTVAFFDQPVARRRGEDQQSSTPPDPGEAVGEGDSEDGTAVVDSAVSVTALIRAGRYLAMGAARWRLQVWVAIWTASQGEPRGGV